MSNPVVHYHEAEAATHFKQRMCERMIRNGTRTSTPQQCLKNLGFKGRTVAAGGVGA
ncbi:MAG: hypothetical protein M0Z99_36295 [Betaproteobacteria bacterium]|nr:hypothetical protein [Betaproteobacteria bacterium]